MIIVEIVDSDIEPFVSSNNQREKGAELIFNGRVRETEHGKKLKLWNMSNMKGWQKKN